MIKIFTVIIGLILSGCAGMNSNPGERTTDINWENKNYTKAIELASAAAERGEPWAQLRLGMYYSSGDGVEVDIPEAIDWYKKAARQSAAGHVVGAAGDSEKNDVLIAQYMLAEIYFKGEGIKKDLTLSYMLINNVIKESAGEPQIFFCCEGSGGIWFRQSQFKELKYNLEMSMAQGQLMDAKKNIGAWSVKNDL